MKFSLALAATLTLTACSGFLPQNRMTPTTYVKFDESGALIEAQPGDPQAIGCQDFDQRYTMWDFAVSYPSSMTEADATAVCRSDEQMKFETGPGTILSGSAHTNDGFVARNANESIGAKDVMAR